MKRQARNHSKLIMLARRLDIPHYAAVGLLESLWHLTAQEAPRGDIGRLSNDRIAVFLDWRGEPDTLINALRDERWLDDHPEHRVIVHDWHDHADSAVHASLARAKLYFANGAEPNLKSCLYRSERDELSQWYAARRCANIHAINHDQSLSIGYCLPEPEPEPEPEPIGGCKGEVPLEPPVPAKSKRAAALKAPDLLPDDLATAAAQSAWTRWLEARRSRRKAVTAIAAQRQIADLRQWGEAAWVEAIDASIRNDWTGLFEPKRNGSQSSIAARNPAHFERKSPKPTACDGCGTPVTDDPDTSVVEYGAKHLCYECVKKAKGVRRDHAHA